MRKISALNKKKNSGIKKWYPPWMYNAIHNEAHIQYL